MGNNADFQDYEKRRQFMKTKKENSDGYLAAKSIGDTQGMAYYHEKQIRDVAEWDEYTGGKSTYDEETGVWDLSEPVWNDLTGDPATNHYLRRMRKNQDDYSSKNYEYDPDKDPLFKQYQTQYTKAGQNAMKDTIAKVAAQTGGIAGSYAVTAGANSYNSYMQELNNIIPELEQLAYQKYQDELNRDLKLYDMNRQNAADAYDYYLDDLQRKEKDKYEQAEFDSIMQKYQIYGLSALTMDEMAVINAEEGYYIDTDSGQVVGNGNIYATQNKMEEDAWREAMYVFQNYGYEKLSKEQRNIIMRFGYYDPVKNWVYRDGAAYAGAEIENNN